MAYRRKSDSLAATTRESNPYGLHADGIPELFFPPDDTGICFVHLGSGFAERQFTAQIRVLGGDDEHDGGMRDWLHDFAFCAGRKSALFSILTAYGAIEWRASHVAKRFDRAIRAGPRRRVSFRACSWSIYPSSCGVQVPAALVLDFSAVLRVDVCFARLRS